MRASRILWAIAILALAASVAPIAEAGSSRRAGRRGAPNGFADGLVRSDEAITAILASTPTGGTAILPPGVFRTSIVIDRSMTVAGSPEGTVLDATGLGRPVVDVAFGVSGVVLRDLRLSASGVDGLVARGGNDRLALERVAIAGSAGVGARILESAGVVLDRCSFESNAGGGLDAAGLSLRASRLAFRGNGSAAADLRGKDARLSDSSFEGGAEGVVFEGFAQSATRNSFRSVGVAARFAATADTCTFERNDVRYAATGVLADLGSIYAAVSANRFSRTTGDVVRLAGSWHAVRGNLFSVAGGAAVIADGSSFQIEDNTVSQTGGTGLVATGPGIMVDNNVLSDTRGGAIDVQGDGNVIAANTSNRSGGDGILVSGSMCRLIGNRVLDAKGDAIVVAGDLDTLQDNLCRGALGNGIRVASGNANVLDANTVLLCGFAGIENDGVGTVFLNNKID